MPVFSLTARARKSPSEPVPESWRLPWESRSLENFAAIRVPRASRMPSDTATTQRPNFATHALTSAVKRGSENGRSGR